MSEIQDILYFGSFLLVLLSISSYIFYAWNPTRTAEQRLGVALIHIVGLFILFSFVHSFPEIPFLDDKQIQIQGVDHCDNDNKNEKRIK